MNDSAHQDEPDRCACGSDTPPGMGMTDHCPVCEPDLHDEQGGENALE